MALPFAALLLTGCAPGAIERPASIHDARNGELLYSTYCVSCHTEQVHWRDKTVAVDWASLQVEVRRWQQATRVQWTDIEIADVSQYLNALHYHFATPD
jgi:mono/diheme cytochrome c family protein